MRMRTCCEGGTGLLPEVMKDRCAGPTFRTANWALASEGSSTRKVRSADRMAGGRIVTRTWGPSDDPTR